MSVATEAAVRAERLQADQAFQDACAALHRVYEQQWREAETPEMRELVWHRDAALTAVQQELVKAVERGAFETTEQTRRTTRG